MTLYEMYENNEQFKRYVDRYAKDNNIIPAQAITHVMVKNYAEYLLNPGEKLDWVLGK